MDKPDFNIRRAIRAPGAPRMVPSKDQCRCSCGAMLARMVADGLELKCRKCKSLVLIRHDELVAMYRELNFQPPVPPPIARR